MVPTARPGPGPGPAQSAARTDRGRVRTPYRVGAPWAGSRPGYARTRGPRTEIPGHHRYRPRARLLGQTRHHLTQGQSGWSATGTAPRAGAFWTPTRRPAVLGSLLAVAHGRRRPSSATATSDLHLQAEALGQLRHRAVDRTLEGVPRAAAPGLDSVTCPGLDTNRLSDLEGAGNHVSSRPAAGLSALPRRAGGWESAPGANRQGCTCWLPGIDFFDQEHPDLVMQLID